MGITYNTILKYNVYLVVHLKVYTKVYLTMQLTLLYRLVNLHTNSSIHYQIAFINNCPYINWMRVTQTYFRGQPRPVNEVIHNDVDNPNTYTHLCTSGKIYCQFEVYPIRCTKPVLRLTS